MEDAHDKWTLVILDPVPLVFPEAFYDGQPRTKDGRFSFGKMRSFSLALNSSRWNIWEKNTNKRVKNIRDCLGGTKLAHERIKDEVAFYTKGLKHIIGTSGSMLLERLARTPEVLKEVFRIGDCREEPVHEGKTKWADKCWHVRIAAKFNGGKTSRVEFVVLHHTEMKANVLYDIHIK